MENCLPFLCRISYALPNRKSQQREQRDEARQKKIKKINTTRKRKGDNEFTSYINVRGIKAMNPFGMVFACLGDISCSHSYSISILLESIAVCANSASKRIAHDKKVLSTFIAWTHEAWPHECIFLFTFSNLCEHNPRPSYPGRSYWTLTHCSSVQMSPPKWLSSNPGDCMLNEFLNYHSPILRPLLQNRSFMQLNISYSFIPELCLDVFDLASAEITNLFWFNYSFN